MISIAKKIMVDINTIRSKYHLEMLSADELVTKQSATLQLLENVGIRSPSKIALGVFAEHGVPVEKDCRIVWLPRIWSLNNINHFE